jgi:hypothetical protein
MELTASTRRPSKWKTSSQYTAFEIRKKLEERSIGNIVFVTLFYMILEVKDDKVCPICGKPLSIKINRKKGTKFYSCQPAQFGGEGCGYIENI